MLIFAICDGIGVEPDDLYRDKRDWTADRGRRHDINFPFLTDIENAADEIMQTIETAGWGPKYRG